MVQNFKKTGLRKIFKRENEKAQVSQMKKKYMEEMGEGKASSFKVLEWGVVISRGY